MHARSLVYIFLLGLLVMASGCMPKAASISGLIDRSCTETDGTKALLSDLLGQRATVFITLDPECPYSQLYTHVLQDLADRFGSQGVNFIGIYPTQFIERSAALRFSEQGGMRFVQLMDSTCELSVALEARVTPEAFVTGPEGTVVYRGAIDDQAVREGRKKLDANKPYLADAIEAYLRDGHTQKEVPAVGCIVECESL